MNNEAIASLKTFPALQRLDVTGTRIDEQGLARLRQAKPKCKILAGAGSKTAHSEDDLIDYASNSVTLRE